MATKYPLRSVNTIVKFLIIFLQFYAFVYKHISKGSLGNEYNIHEYKLSTLNNPRYPSFMDTAAVSDTPRLWIAPQQCLKHLIYG